MWSIPRGTCQLSRNGQGTQGGIFSVPVLSHLADAGSGEVVAAACGFGCGFDAVPEGVRVKAGGGACGDKQVIARPAAGLRHLLIRPGFTQVNTCVNYSFPVPAVAPGQGSPSSVQDLIDANWTPRRNGA